MQKTLDFLFEDSGKYDVKKGHHAARNKVIRSFKKDFLLSGLTFSKFIDYIKEGLIVYDIRIGVYKTGNNFGKTHDHGSGFRISKENLDTVFNVDEL